MNDGRTLSFVSYILKLSYLYHIADFRFTVTNVTKVMLEIEREKDEDEDVVVVEVNEESSRRKSFTVSLMHENRLDNA